MSEVEFEARQAKEQQKAKEKEAKEAQRFENGIKKLEYERKLEQMDMQTLMKIKERKDYLKENYKKSKDGLTGS